jgi:hypothetical protein
MDITLLQTFTEGRSTNRYIDAISNVYVISKQRMSSGGGDGGYQKPAKFFVMVTNPSMLSMVGLYGVTNLKVDGKQVDTPPKELELIYHLASHPNKVFTRDQLLDEVWGFEYYVDSRTVDVHIKRLREKLKGVSDKWELKTVWSVGYKFATNE